MFRLKLKRHRPVGVTPSGPPSGIPFDTYEARSPSIQNAIDAIPGWNTSFPPEYGIIAGNRVNFADDRIIWAMDQFGPIEGASVLELGPLEGAQTYLLDRRGANIIAVEANKRAFLKCLITKEIMGLPNAKFLLGDFVQYLEQNERRYDLIVACGVLYHMPNPLRLLEAISARTNAVYIWTSYLDLTPIPSDDPVLTWWEARREIQSFRGRDITMYRRTYEQAYLNPDFCGGIYNEPRWMTRESILRALQALNFSVELAHEAQPTKTEHCFSIFAKR